MYIKRRCKARKSLHFYQSGVGRYHLKSKPVAMFNNLFKKLRYNLCPVKCSDLQSVLTTAYQAINFFISLECSLLHLSGQSPNSSINYCFAFYPYHLVLFILEFLISGIIWSVFFCVLFLSLRIIFLRFIHRAYQ